MRNAGTWAGNLGMFNRHQDFPSDAVLALTTAQATLTLLDSHGTFLEFSMEQFLGLPTNALEVNTGGLMLIALTIQEASVPAVAGRETIMETFKLCLREHNSHAMLNAGCRFTLEAPEQPGDRIVYDIRYMVYAIFYML